MFHPTESPRAGGLPGPLSPQAAGAESGPPLPSLWGETVENRGGGGGVHPPEAHSTPRPGQPDPGRQETEAPTEQGFGPISVGGSGETWLEGAGIFSHVHPPLLHHTAVPSQQR